MINREDNYYKGKCERVGKKVDVMSYGVRGNRLIKNNRGEGLAMVEIGI
jgi:hypothetical protein